ncbi:MAG: Mov34/MPN/PAD-1 family protein [Patescibacteria group bacterium]|nr:Mov34/MPN/PAD-1 family protein [Patescibacteria group bacterium]
MSTEPLFIHETIPVYNGLDDNFTTDNLPALAYIIDAKGWKLYRRNCVSTAVVAITSLDKAPIITELCEYKAAKVPITLINQIVAFFREVYKRHSSEAVGYLYYKDQQWQFIVPDQTVSVASCNYGAAPVINSWRLAGTIHSHGNMAAFHSGTDCKDETNFDGLHITIGRLSDPQPEFACSLVTQGTRFKAEPQLVIAAWPEADIPTQWLERVHTSKLIAWNEADMDKIAWNGADPKTKSRKQRPPKTNRVWGNDEFSLLSKPSFFDIRRFGRWS